MRKASEYRQHAAACRTLAKSIGPGDQQNQLLAMAETWDMLAQDRSDLVSRHPELALDGERDEEAERSRSRDPSSPGTESRKASSA